MKTPWLTLIGIGDDGYLSPAAHEFIKTARIVYGGARHFEKLDVAQDKKRLWPSPFSNIHNDLKMLAGTPTVLLATGDPQWYGVGSSVVSSIPAEDVRILPALSAFQLASARLHWPLQNVECLSLHGRPLETLQTSLYPGGRIIALTSNGDTPARVAALLTSNGFGSSRLHVLEHMGGSKERILQGRASEWQHTCADFNTLAIELNAAADQRWLPRCPGLPDDAFRHDGKMTKREVRAITLAALAPFPQGILWDIGSGCGSIGIEWMRAARGAKAIGLEPDETRRLISLENAAALGVPGLEVRQASAPEGLTGLPEPDAIFIGGGLTGQGMIETCLDILKPGGKLVANAVTLESEQILLQAWQDNGGDLVRLGIQRAHPVGNLTGWKPLMPVTQWAFSKKETT